MASSTIQEGERLPLSPLQNPSIEVNNRLTRYARNITCALAVVTAFETIATFTAHGEFASVASDVMVFGGGATVVMGCMYLGLRFIRDRWQAGSVREDMQGGAVPQAGIDAELASLEVGSTLKKRVVLDGKVYWMEVLKGESGIERVSLKNA